MSGARAIVPYKIADAVNIASNYTGTKSNIQNIDKVSYQVIFTGSPNGELFVESSVDGLTSWVPLDMPQMLVTAADEIQIDVQNTGFPSIRLRWAAASGSGTMTAFIAGKGD